MRNFEEEKLYGERITALRIAAGRSQQEVAAVLEIPLCQYVAYEQGRSVFMVKHGMILAAYYGVSLDYIAGLTDFPQSPLL